MSQETTARLQNAAENWRAHDEFCKRLTMAPITKAEFLSKPYVGKFLTFLSERFDSSARWTHYWYDRSGRKWHFNSLNDAHEQYMWPMPNGKGWKATKVELDGYRCRLREATQLGDADRLARVCVDILAWGLARGAAFQVNREYVEQHRVTLPMEFLHTCENVLAKDSTPSSRRAIRYDPSRESTECRMNAGFVKIYSLLCEYCVMYDSRVAAGLGLLVRQFCIGERDPKQGVPKYLAFMQLPGQAKRPRDPSCCHLRFPKQWYSRSSISSPSYRHTTNTILASWLLQAALEKNRGKFSAGENGFHELAAGLFMVGYDLQYAPPWASGVNLGRYA